MKNKWVGLLLAVIVLSGDFLGISLIPVQAAGVTYYVATNGDDTNPGTITQPFLTIQTAADLVNPGDTVIIRSGTYMVSSGAFPSPISANPAIYINRSGSAEGGYIVFKSEVRGGAKIVSTGGYDVILINANYIEVDGLDVSGDVEGHCIETENSHHTRIINGRFHDCGGAGIAANYGDYYHFEGNITYNNANTNVFATSGISIYQARAISDNAPGFHNIIRNNISYNNIELDTGTHTDGNGIIIDDFKNTQNESTAGVYPYQTLVENNLTFHNGAKGIVVYLSDNVVIRNNTVFWNNRDNLNNSTWRGEINVSMASNITVVNNIIWSNPAYNRFNTAIVDAAYDDYVNTGNIWQNNMTFNGTAGNPSIRVDINGESSPDSTTRLGEILATSANNRLGVNPRFINPVVNRSANFRLQASSPAINIGTSNFELPSLDLDGNARVIGSAVDLGAYEFGGRAVPIDLLTNGGFETAGLRPRFASNWTSNPVNPAGKRICDTHTKPIVTLEGECFFQFSTDSAPTVGRSLKQTLITGNLGVPGEMLTLTAFIEGNKLKTGAKIVVNVTYTDSNTAKTSVVIPKGTYAFTPISNSLNLTKTVQKIVVNINIAKVTGRIRLDNIRLILSDAALLALPSNTRDIATQALFAFPNQFQSEN